MKRSGAGVYVLIVVVTQATGGSVARSVASASRSAVRTLRCKEAKEARNWRMVRLAFQPDRGHGTESPFVAAG